MKSLDAIFKPKSIAVVGATTRPGSIGREILRNLFDFEFNGKIFPVNPRYEYIHSVKAYPTVLSIPDEVDLAVIVVPKDYVLQAVEDCGRKGVGGLVIISAGFREVGGEGVKREEKIVRSIEKYDMRLIGPNCMGVIAATPVRAVVELAGVKNLLSKSFGSNNPVNLVRATMDGLRQLRTREEIAALRGVSLK